MDELTPSHALPEAVRQAVARARGSVLARVPAREGEPAPRPSAPLDEQRLDRLRRLNGQLRGANSVIHELADTLPDLEVPVVPIALTDEERAAREEALRLRLLKRRVEDLELSLAETLPFRVRVAWRIVREMARLKNLVDADQLLADIGFDDDPWSNPVRGRVPMSKSWMRRLDATLIRALEISVKSGRRGEGVPLLPPAVPLDWRDAQGLVRDDYNPGDDADLRAFLKVAGLIASHYAMADFETERGAEGELGLEGMLDLDAAHMCWPRRDQIMRFEETVVDEARQLLATRGQFEARKYLDRAHGLRPREIDSVIRMAASTAVEMTDFSIEEVKALMILKLEDYEARAREELNMNNEHRAHKLQVLVHGLSRTEAANPFAEFASAVESARALANDGGGDEKPKLEVFDVPAAISPPSGDAGS